VSLFVDSGVWSLAFRRDAVATAVEVMALRQSLEAGDTILTTGLVLQELLQGFAGPRALADSSSNVSQRCRSSIRIGKITLKPPIYATVAVARAFKFGLLMLCLPNFVFVTVSRCSRPRTTFLGLPSVFLFGCGKVPERSAD
jgi:hypothetical protein